MSAPPFVVHQWTPDQGLPQSTVTDITQTPDGYLWIATWGGLARFDGVRFTLFGSREHPGIGSDRVRALAVDSNGVLWAGTEGGLVRFDGGAFTTLTTREGLPENVVTVLHVDRRGVLWIGTEHQGLVRYQRGRFTRFGVAEGLPHPWVYRVLEDTSGILWVDTPQGHAQLRPGADRLIASPAALARRSPLLRDREGYLWFGSDDAVHRWDGNSLRRYAIGHEQGDPIPIRVTQDGNGDLWIVGWSGVQWLRPGPETAFGRIALADGRRTFAARSVFVDREGTRWVGTEVDGLLSIRPRHFRVYTRSDGLSTDQITAVLGEPGGRLWIGTNCDRLSVMDGRRIRAFADVRGDWIGCVWSLAHGADGSIWMGSWGAGLARYQEGRLTKWGRAAGLSDDVILSLLTDRAGVLWVGTNAGGLNRFERGRVTAVYDTASGLPHNSVRFLYEDRAGALWIGTVGGLARMDGERFTVFTRANGLPHDFVRAVYQDADGVYWIGSYGGGLTRFRGGRFTPIGRDAGLFDDVVSAILEDGNGNLWMSGNRGIFRASRAALNDYADGRATRVYSVPYGAPDGLISPETNGGFQPAAWRGADGRLWFPTVKGLAVVDPRAAAPNPLAPRVVIEEVLLDGRPAPAGGAIAVPPEVRQLEIRYTGLHSAAPEHLSFRYRLHGVDRDWVYVGGRRTAYYTRLPPGDYRFTVDAASRDGLWNGTGASVGLGVLAPFWLTWWFRLLAAGAAGSALWGIVRARLARLQAAHAAQQEFSRRLIEREEAERKRIAAELHDSIGQDLLVVKNRASLALEGGGADAMRDQLRQISDIVGDAIRETRAIAQNLRPVQLDRLGLAAALRAAVERAAQGSGIRFTVDVEGGDEALPREAEINLFRAVQEGVNNILKHSGATEATVLLHREDRALRVVVSDNGRGLGAAAAGRGVGMGLSGIAERVRLLGGRHEIETAPGEGTTHRIVIPL